MQFLPIGWGSPQMAASIRRDVNETKHYEVEAETNTKRFKTKTKTEPLRPRPCLRGRDQKVYGLLSRCYYL